MEFELDKLAVLERLFLLNKSSLWLLPNKTSDGLISLFKNILLTNFFIELFVVKLLLEKVELLLLEVFEKIVLVELAGLRVFFELPMINCLGRTR